MGGDAPRGELPASGCGGINRRRTSLREARKRDGTVGRSDAIESNLALHRDSDPVRMMRPRCAEPIRASSPPGLHQQAGHMTASDPCTARNMTSCKAGTSTHDQGFRSVRKHTTLVRDDLALYASTIGKFARRLVIGQQRLPWGIRFQHPCWSGGFFEQQLRLDEGAAMRPKCFYPDGAGTETLGEYDDIADPNEVSSLPDDRSVEGDPSSRAKAGSERTAFGETGEPQPLIEASACRF